jgi:hypothetical protein
MSFGIEVNLAANIVLGKVCIVKYDVDITTAAGFDCFSRYAKHYALQTACSMYEVITLRAARSVHKVQLILGSCCSLQRAFFHV